MSTPDIRVEKGHAEPEEVAAITAILLARAAAAPAEAPAHRPLPKAGFGVGLSARVASAPRTAGTEAFSAFTAAPLFFGRVGPLALAGQPMERFLTGRSRVVMGVPSGNRQDLMCSEWRELRSR